MHQHIDTCIQVMLTCEPTNKISFFLLQIQITRQRDLNFSFSPEFDIIFNTRLYLYLWKTSRACGDLICFEWKDPLPQGGGSPRVSTRTGEVDLQPKMLKKLSSSSASSSSLVRLSSSSSGSSKSWGGPEGSIPWRMWLSMMSGLLGRSGMASRGLANIMR